MAYHYLNSHSASAVTNGSFLVTLASWSAHLPVIIMTISAIATVAGVALQFWLAIGRQRELEKRLEELEREKQIKSIL